jgi:hypothetical protein
MQPENPPAGRRGFSALSHGFAGEGGGLPGRATISIDKVIRRERRHVRHKVEVTDVRNLALRVREVRDILSL